MKKIVLLRCFMLFTILNYSQSTLISTSIDNALFPTYKSSTTKIFSTELLKERLIKLDSKTQFNVVYNASIEGFVRSYINNRQDVIANLMDKSHYYFPIFEEYLDKYDLPLEIKYLAVVESALEAEAKSAAGATGIWQFMFYTGKQYNLHVTPYVDDRSDVLKATKAACEYLQDLYKRFNDWDLVLAAYNAGPGNVSKAIRKSGGMRNYWNIRKYLPKETRNYVPTFYTIMYLFEYGNEHNIRPKNTQINFHQTDTIIIKRESTFNEIKRHTGINDALLRFLNPQYKLAIIPASNNAKYTLTLPKYMVDKFVMNTPNFKFKVSNTTKSPTYITPTRSNSYVVQHEDNLLKITEKFNISSQQLKNWNGLNSDYLVKDQRLVITSTTSAETVLTTSKKTTMYLVKEGDSLWKISKKFANVSINNLRNWNEIWGVNHLKPGTVLKILTD